MKTIFQDRPIEWDDEKNEINVRKHGISFETAAYVLQTRIASSFTTNFIVMRKTGIRSSAVSGKCSL